MDQNTKKLLCNELGADLYDVATATTNEEIEIALAALVKDGVEILIDVQKNKQEAGTACIFKKIFNSEDQNNAK